MQTVYADTTVVDKDDNVIGRIQLPDGIEKGVIFRVTRVYIFNSKGELLLQKRGPNILAPNRWCESASGHVDYGESYATTAERETEEELNVSGIDFTEIDHYFYKEVGPGWTVRRFNTLYEAHYDGEINPDPDEVAGFRWVELDKLAEEVKATPDLFTIGFIESFRRYQELKKA